MQSPPLTEEQRQRQQHLFALAQGFACSCRACAPAPRRLCASLVYQERPFTQAEVRRMVPTLRAARGVR